jgi:transposase
MVSNAIEALQRQPIIRKLALKRLQQTLKTLTQQVDAVEAELLALLEERFATPMTLLCSIPGIGRKTAGMLLLSTGGFTHLDNYRQVIAMAGVSLREHTSSTSIRGKVRMHEDRQWADSLIAVCNKLLKQAFAIVKSGVPY